MWSGGESLGESVREDGGRSNRIPQLVAFTLHSLSTEGFESQ